MLNEEALYRAAPPWAQTILLNLHAVRIHRHRFGAPLREALAALQRRERASPEEVRDYQNARLRRVVQVAYDRSPYYRKRMEALGLTPADIRGVGDLPKLPLLTKEEIRTRLTGLLTAAAPQPSWLHGHTSGTTGSPLDLWYDRETAILTNATDLLQKRWVGMGARDWIGLLLGRVVVNPSQQRPPFWRANYLHRQVWFSSFHLSPENLDLYAAEIRRSGLRFLEGYPSTLFILAQHLERTERTLPMRAVFSSSETLHAVQRETIERAFACQLYDFYGLAERVLFAIECDHQVGKHVVEEYGYVEIVDEQGAPVPDGQTGYLVGTSLHNTALPLLRYRTSDLSRVLTERCPCGRSGRLLDNVTTKAEDIVVTPDGRLISPSILTHPFKPFHQILKSQIVQDEVDRLLVKIVPSEEFTAACQARLVTGLRERLGEAVDIEVQLVKEIPREPSGKFRWVISRVRHPCHFTWA